MAAAVVVAAAADCPFWGLSIHQHGCYFYFFYNSLWLDSPLIKTFYFVPQRCNYICRLFDPQPVSVLLYF